MQFANTDPKNPLKSIRKKKGEVGREKSLELFHNHDKAADTVMGHSLSQ
jgi:hypothetical protein